MFYWLSKLIWLIISPASLLVIVAVVGWILLIRNRYRPAKWCFGLLASVLVMIALFPVGDWLMLPLEERFETNPLLPTQVDGIIVLSGSEEARKSQYWQQSELNRASERHFAFVALARQYPDAKLVFTGGGRPELILKEADVAKHLYQSLGLDTDRIIFEKQAKNTAENAVFSKKMVEPQVGEHWILITTAWHMPRAIGLFCQVGWPTTPYPVDHWTEPDYMFTIDWDFSGHLSHLNMAVKEWIGLLAYYATGKIASAFPADCLTNNKPL
jgi:uncharacterized SAM-binding protein YcdF (DUF218 family)